MRISPKSLLASIILCSIILSGCGKKGPLYLPDEPEKQAQAINASSLTIQQQALRLLPTENRLQQDKS